MKIQNRKVQHVGRPAAVQYVRTSSGLCHICKDCLVNHLYMAKKLPLWLGTHENKKQDVCHTIELP